MSEAIGLFGGGTGELRVLEYVGDRLLVDVDEV